MWWCGDVVMWQMKNSFALGKTSTHNRFFGLQAENKVE
jgi:hypothetical protein